jgi:rhamnulokinase
VAQTENYLAIDLGAESGRAMLGSFDGERLSLEEAHRFPNPGIRVLGSLHWDVLRLFEEMKNGLRQAASRKPVSIGVDTWGVDYALLDRTGALVGNPSHYRDSRTNGTLSRVLGIVPKKEIFEHTGLQFMEINTLFQLFSMKGTPALDSAATFLMMPDLFHYWFTGRKASEFTDATTTQFYDPRKKAWATGLLAKLGLPTGIYPEIVPPGTVWGELTGSVADECGVERLSVVAPACHDTGSAVAAVPATGADWAFLSSGTWSLLGVEVPRPYVTDVVLDRNFTNEGGVWGTTRLLKNICGMWLLEECRRDWSKQGLETTYAKLLAEAQQQPAFRSLLNVNDPLFVAPGGMPSRIADFCRRSGQPAPETPGAFVRAIFESLALTYRLVIDDLEAITGRRAQTLHIVGGGSQNELVCQYAANATGMRVVAGPVEATSLGNVLLQAMAMGRVADAQQAREIVRRSFEPKTYAPAGDATAWQDAAGRLKRLLHPIP